MAAVLSLLGVLVISLLVTRVGATALRLTGMSSEAAEFQSRSAFTGVGFTTLESEDILNHPVRRRILMHLMLLSNLGVGAVVATLMLSLPQATTLTGFCTAAIGILGFWMLRQSLAQPLVQPHLSANAKSFAIIELRVLMIGIIILVSDVTPLTAAPPRRPGFDPPASEGMATCLVVLLDHSCLYHSPGKT